MAQGTDIPLRGRVRATFRRLTYRRHKHAVWCDVPRHEAGLNAPGECRSRVVGKALGPGLVANVQRSAIGRNHAVELSLRVPLHGDEARRQAVAEQVAGHLAQLGRASVGLR